MYVTIESVALVTRRLKSKVRRLSTGVEVVFTIFTPPDTANPSAAPVITVTECIDKGTDGLV